MTQRGNSKKTKLRMEEDELDRQLMAAGLLDDGMSFAQKREMAQFLSLSVSSAQEEETQRKNREFEEEKLMEDTLNSSINPNKDLPDDSDNSRGSDVVILSSGPDSDSQAPRSSQLSKGIFGLDKSQNAKKSSEPVSLCKSDQDMFCDSQGEKQEQKNLVATPASLEKRFEKFISTTSADSSFESAHHKLENIQKTYSSVSSRRGIRKHPTTDDISSPSTKALRRHATVHEVSSPTKVQHNLGNIEKAHSQSLFSSGSSNISVRRDSSLPTMDTDEETQLFSPVIGGRKVINGRTVSELQKGNSSNVQESQISNSLEVVRLHTEKSNIDDDSSTDEEIISSPVPSPSTLLKTSTPAGVLSKSRLSAVSTPNTSNVNLRLSDSPGISPAKGKSPIRPVAVVDDDDDEATQEINFTPSVSSTDKGVAASKHENVQTHHSDKDSENSSDGNDNFSYTIDWKKSVKVFPLSNSDTEPLLRKNMRSEKRSLAYMKHEKESANESKKRIVSLIDISYDILEKYQESVGNRMNWGTPVLVDKRIKEWTLIRPVQIIRKLLPPSEESSGIRRATRQTRKVQEQNQAGDSDDSLPNIDSNSQDLNKVTKLKPSSQGSSVNKKISNNVDDKCRLVNEDSDDDLADFNIFPSKHSKQLGKTTVELADSTPRKHLRLSQDVDYVSSSRLQEDTKKNYQERNINFELSVSDGDNGNNKTDQTPSKIYVNSPKRKINDSLEESRPIKRRKTFMLNVDEDEVASSSNISDSVNKHKLKESSCDTEVTSVIDEGDDCQQDLSNKNLTEEVEDLHLTREQKKETNFVSSSYEVSKEVGIPGPSSSSTDLLILENSGASAIKVDHSANRTSDSRGVSKSRQGVQIRPGRLKLFSKRNNGKRRDASNEEGDQISSSLEQDTADIEEIEKVECPLCAREFPLDKIEVHAATCDGQVDSTVEEVEDKSLFQRATARSVPNTATTAAAKENTSTRRPIAATIPEKRPRTPPNFVRCYLCDDVFPEGDEYAVHVSECDGQRKIVEGIKSPSFTDSPRTWATKRMQRDPKPIQTSNKSKIINKPRSVFEKIEDGLVEYVNGDITDVTFATSDTAIIQQINCIGVKPHGLSETLAKKYPYCNSYEKRKPIGSLNRAILKHRPKPGRLNICRPNNFTLSDKPIVVNIVGQFYMGKEQSKNFMTNKLIKKLRESIVVKENNSENNIENCEDPHLLDGLIKDTAENRLSWFTEAIVELGNIAAHEGIAQLVFPYKIGCGLAGGNWERYLPVIKKLASTVRVQGITVKIVIKEHSSEENI